MSAQTGTVGILNVGAGDVKLVFDNSNPAECIRAARIVTDMLRRGYALLVEVEVDGVKKFRRALDFNAATCEYIIADFDPVEAGRADRKEGEREKETAKTAPSDPAGAATPARGREPRRRGVPASSTRAVAIARSAGG